jgi:integrase
MSLIIQFKTLKVDPIKWTSEYESINNLVKDLMRKTKSRSSLKLYTFSIHKFFKHLDVDPDTFIKWDKKKVEKSIQDFIDIYSDNPRRANLFLSHLVKLCYSNGFRIGRRTNLEIESFYVPTRYRRTKEHIPTPDEIRKIVSASGSLRDRTMILTLYVSGLRNSDLRSLKWRDIDLDNGDQPVKIEVTPELKKIVPEACKGSIRYYTFVKDEAVESLRLYRDYIEKKYGIDEDSVIFNTEDHRINMSERKYIPLDARTLCVIIKKLCRNAGLKNWKEVHPHSLRKAFQSAMRNSGLDDSSQEFMMGHVLAGSKDYYYDPSKVDELREKYSKIKFFNDVNKETKDKLSDAEKEIGKLRRELNNLRIENVSIKSEAEKGYETLLKRIEILEKKRY